LLAGFRTSGESERPGFAWLFGRDALWTALALDAEGDVAATRTALDFLKKYQRADGKIPHEISQSAAFIPWFTDYPYPWNSADATPRSPERRGRGRSAPGRPPRRRTGSRPAASTASPPSFPTRSGGKRSRDRTASGGRGAWTS